MRSLVCAITSIHWSSPGASYEGLCLDAECVYVSTKTGVRAARRSDGGTTWSHTIDDGRMYVGVMNPDSLGFAIAEFTPQTTAIDPAPATSTFVMQAYPNPFASSTNAALTLPEAAHVRIDVVDVLGRSCGIVKDGWLDAGAHTIPVVFTPHVGAEAAGTYRLRCLVRTPGATRQQVLPLLRIN